jgi:hypothetical protein
VTRPTDARPTQRAPSPRRARHGALGAFRALGSFGAARGFRGSGALDAFGAFGAFGACGALVVLAACERPATLTPQDSPAPAAIEAPAPFDAAAWAPPAFSPTASEPVQLRTGPGGHGFDVTLRTAGAAAGHERRFGVLSMPTALRTTERTNYPCSSCHVPGRPVIRPDRVGDAHQDIQPVHPAESGATCATCHAGDDVASLRLHSGATLPLDQAYRLCTQCHFAQVDAWAGGAHGKRLDGWRGPRVVMGCADCHDPHAPAIEQRVPYPGPPRPGTGGRR